MEMRHKLVLLCAVLLPVGITGCGDDSNDQGCSLTEESCQSEGKTLNAEKCICAEKSGATDCTGDDCNKKTCTDSDCGKDPKDPTCKGDDCGKDPKDPTCKGDVWRCNGAELQQCVNSDWKTKETCSSAGACDAKAQKCTTSEIVEPVLECAPESVDIDHDGKIDCLVRTIPLNALPELPEIEGKCGEWSYPKHHTVEYPDLPEFSYETTIDLEKYGISNTYEPEKAKENSAALTKAIKEAKKAGFTRIRIPDGHYALKHFDGIHIPSKTALIMSENVILQMAPTDETYCSLLNADEDSNIYIEGGTLIGDMSSHPDAKDDQECGAFIFYNVDHIFINKMTIKDMRGDGIMILDYEPDADAPTSHDFIIANSNFVDNYRNGIAVVGCDGIRISNNEIHHTHGADPQFGIDFEANKKSRANKRAIVDHNYFHDNVGGDIILDNYETFIEYNRFSQGNMSLYTVNPFIPRGYSSYIMYRNTFEKFTKSTGCASKIGCTNHSETDATSLNFFVENDIGDAQLQLKDRTNVCIKENTGKHISAANISNLRVIDNKAQQYSFSKVTGKASGNQRCSAEGVCQAADDVNAMTQDKSFSLE